MMIDLFLIAFLFGSFVYLGKEKNSLPDIGDLLEILFEKKISNSFSLLLCCLLILFIPFILCYYTIIKYKKHSTSYKRPLIDLFLTLKFLFYYSFLSKAALECLKFIELLTSSKIKYFIFRMLEYRKNKDFCTSILFRILLEFTINSLSFIIVFFLYVSYIVYHSTSISININRFLNNNRTLIIVNICFISFYITLVNYMSYKYSIFHRKETLLAKNEAFAVNSLVATFINIYILSLRIFVIESNN